MEHALDVTIGQPFVDGQREGLGAIPRGVGSGGRRGARGEAGERGLLGEGAAVVDRGLDLGGGEGAGEGVATGGPHDVVVDGVAGAAGEGADVLGEAGVVGGGDGAAAGDAGVEVGEVAEEDGGLDGVEAAVGAEVAVDAVVDVGRGHAVGGELAGAVGELGIVGEDDAAVPRRAEGLRGVEAGGPDGAGARGRRRADGLRDIVEDGHAEVGEGAGLAEEVDGDDGAGARGEGERGGVEEGEVVPHVRDDGDGADAADGLGGGEEGEEVITTVALTFKPVSGGAAVEATWADPENDGSPVIDDIVLSDTEDYTLAVSFLNEIEDPAEDITEEVDAESDQHQVFFTGTGVESPATGENAGAVVSQAYDDTDANGFPIGLASSVVTLGVGSGTLTVTLRHLPPENDTPVKTGTLADDVAAGGIESLPGETDASVDFALAVQ